MIATPNKISKEEAGHKWISVGTGRPATDVEVEVSWSNSPHRDSTDRVIDYPLLMWGKGYNHTHWRYKENAD